MNAQQQPGARRNASHRTSKSWLASMVVGTVVFSLTNWALDGPLLGGFHPGLLGLVAGSAVFVIGSLLRATSVEEEKRAEAIVTVA